jgi:FkbM family methyltransferase
MLKDPSDSVLSLLRQRWRSLPHDAKGIYFEYVLNALMRDLIDLGDSVVDAGANYGCHTFTMLDRVGKAGVVYAFEPNPELAAKLRKWKRRNLRVLELALSDHAGSAKFLVADQGGLHSLHLQSNKGMTVRREVTVRIATLDQCLPDANVHFLKVDVEGEEIALLRGAQTVMRRSQPFIVAEIDWLSVFPVRSQAREFREWLASLGYRPMDFFGEWLSEFDEQAWNVLLVPTRTDTNRILSVLESAGTAFFDRDLDWTPQRVFERS